MPCYSTVTRTQMKDEARLAAALRALGYEVVPGTNVVTAWAGGREVRFSRDRAGEAFGTFETDVDRVKAVQRKYSELAVRELAKRRGYSVVGEGRKLTLVNRRGGK